MSFFLRGKHGVVISLYLYKHIFKMAILIKSIFPLLLPGVRIRPDIAFQENVLCFDSVDVQANHDKICVEGLIYHYGLQFLQIHFNHL